MNYILPLLFLVIDNISVGKMASQARNYDKFHWHAWLAVDGNLGQDEEFKQKSCARVKTIGSDPAWWALDLANGDPKLLFVIRNVTIYFEKNLTVEGMLALCMSHLCCKELSYCYGDSHV